jgi:hypothetical protein
MKRFIIGLLFTIPVILAAEEGDGQTGAHLRGDASCRRMEIRVARLMDKAREIREKEHFEYQDDSVIAVENQITAILLYGLRNDPVSLHYSFPLLRKRLVKISGSPDGRLRFYSWDTEGGGTEGAESSIVQYRTAKGIHAGVIFDAAMDSTGDPGMRYTKIYPVTFGKDPLYLVVGDALFSASSIGVGVRAFRIDGDRLKDSLKVFVDEGELVDELTIEYDYFSYLSHGKPEVRFDPATGILYVPRTGDHGVIWRRYDRYVFDKRVFKQKR